MKLILSLVFALSLCVGCGGPEGPEMQKRFGDGRAVLMCDEDGGRFVVTHVRGALYEIRVLKNREKAQEAPAARTDNEPEKAESQRPKWESNERYRGLGW